MSKILLIDDEPSIRDALKHLFQSEGYEVALATSAAEGLAAVNTNDFQVVVTDWKMPNDSGMDVIKSLRASQPRLPVILMTGHDTPVAAIEATKLGAYDYIRKPGTPEEIPELLDLVAKAVANSRRMSEPVELGNATHVGDAIVGSSRVMQDVYKQIGRVAATPITVLIRGETGSGKELVARAIYQHSQRAGRPFIEVNCAAIPETLLESELFGHERGAFTGAHQRRIGRFEQAHQGTIFLDEIGDMSANTQAKLLRVLQDRHIQRLGGRETIETDVRVIAATHRNLEEAMRQSTFREDLYYRLNDALITLPPLRERREDIPELVRFFIRRYSAELGSSQPSMPEPDAIAYLQEQTWPGNVRELRNVIRESLLLARDAPITREIVERLLAQKTPGRTTGDQSMAGYVAQLLAKAKRGELENVHAALTEIVERELYSQALRLAGGDQSKAAGWLGVSRPTMRDKLLKYGFHPSQDES
ncbi:MAG: sigma-54-dependent Fis family transcriptional regulator [Verrucomicrobia bacterium]|nr:MAG: sigma-54-dependent Fis family transcriptional regulator [Verrucomicrobiota bacterium]